MTHPHGVCKEALPAWFCRAAYPVPPVLLNKSLIVIKLERWPDGMLNPAFPAPVSTEFASTFLLRP